MTRFRYAAFTLLLLASLAPAVVAADADGERLRQIVSGPQRTPENTVRDRYRNPLPMLSFLKIQPAAKVIDILPGSNGYWTEILAPYLKEQGQYIAAIPKANPDRPQVVKSIADHKAKYASDPANYSKVAIVDFSATEPNLGADSSADFVLVFRELHNWMATGTADSVLKSAYAVLKRRGIFAIEGHRGSTDQPQDPLAKSGYVREDYAITLIEKAGFKLLAKSEVNANPKDTKDYAPGVWALPPTYRLKDLDREKFAAIGESDRFVMMFEKP